jgi:hypothetical protein
MQLGDQLGVRVSGLSKSRPDVWLRSPEQGPELAVCYSWIGDRYQHRISAWIDGRERVIAESVESEAGNSPFEWPAFQDISVEAIGGADVACLVGMSGKAYWSASVERTLRTPGLSFDLSCKGSMSTVLKCAYAFSSPLNIAKSGRLVAPLDSEWCCVVIADRIDGRVGVISTEFDRLAITGPSRGANRAGPLRIKHQWLLLAHDEVSTIDAA